MIELTAFNCAEEDGDYVYRDLVAGEEFATFDEAAAKAKEIADGWEDFGKYKHVEPLLECSGGVWYLTVDNGNPWYDHEYLSIRIVDPERVIQAGIDRGDFYVEHGVVYCDLDEMPFDKADDTGFGLVHATGRAYWDGERWQNEYEEQGK